jgi:acetyl-CoA carboxylase carboxyltransferase component
VVTHITTNYREGWQTLQDELQRRTDLAQSMGGQERIDRQHARGRLTARERVEIFCDESSFSEYGALAGGNHPAGEPALAADALVGGTGKVDGTTIVLLVEDFTVKGGSIGHPNAAKRARLVRLALEQKYPLVLMLDGAGERADNQKERYPNSPSDLQLLADLQGKVPVVSLILGTSAGHGALSGMFADLIIMLEGSAMVTAGPPLVQASLGISATPEELGGARMHTAISGVAHNVGKTEQDCFAMARYYLSLLPKHAGHPLPVTPQATNAMPRSVEHLLDIIPPQVNQSYNMLSVLQQLVDTQTLFELQPDYGSSMVTALAKVGGFPCMLVANQPMVMAGAITSEAAEKATHFMTVANNFGLPLITLLDNPGVMPGPESEKSGILKSAARMFAAQRRYRGQKIVVTLRKAFGFGSSVMGMNPWDHQTISIALPGVNLGGVPAIGGAEAAKASDDDATKIKHIQSGAWVPADAMAFDLVVDPRELRNEIIKVLHR